MSNYEISKSSLISLKAEIIKKQEEVRKKGYVHIKKKVPLIIKNRGVEKRSENDSVEDIDLHEKSRLALEAKAKLYEKLSKSKIVNDDPSCADNRYLVRFKDKIKEDKPAPEEIDKSDIDEDVENDYSDAQNSDEEWVEYVDSLGRTRTCLKKDLQHFKSRDEDFKLNEQEELPSNNKSSDENASTEISNERELLSEDMRKAILRQQWEKEENELRDKDSIHYQDILFNEARTHGVGYYSFSKQEAIRRQQQMSLEKLRIETQQEQKKYQELKLMREKQLSTRLKAARMRKQARLGLPLGEEEDEEPEIGPPIPSTEPEKSEEDVMKEKLLEEARKNHVRPWDVGKIKVGEFYEYSQEEWVEKKRNERIDEFAPPSTSRRDFRAAAIELKVSEIRKTLRFSTKKTESKFENNYKPHSKVSNEELQDPFNEETRSFQPFTFTNKPQNKRKYKEIDSLAENSCKNVCPVSEHISSNVLLDSEEEHSKNVENNIGNTTDLNSSTSKLISQDIEASIEVGLKFLRNQAERKESVRDYENDDMFAL